MLNDGRGGHRTTAQWRQHPAVTLESEPGKSVQAAVHRALRAVLTARSLRVRLDDGPHAAPIVLVSPRPRLEDVRGRKAAAAALLQHAGRGAAACRAAGSGARLLRRVRRF